jgi:hypothetical protein
VSPFVPAPNGTIAVAVLPNARVPIWSHPARIGEPRGAGAGLEPAKGGRARTRTPARRSVPNTAMASSCRHRHGGVCRHKKMGAGIAASPHCAERRIRQIFQNQIPGEPDSRNFGSPAQASLSTDPLPPRRSPAASTPMRRPEGLAFRFEPARPDRSQNRPMFRGPSWDDPLPRPALLPDGPKAACPPRRAFERSSLPAPLPGWPRKVPERPFHCPPRRSDLKSPAAPSCRCRLSDEAGTAVPITGHTLAPDRESSKAENSTASLWITWISGTTA